MEKDQESSSCGQQITDSRLTEANEGNAQGPDSVATGQPKSVKQFIKNEIKNLVEAYKDYLKNTEF